MKPNYSTNNGNVAKLMTNIGIQYYDFIDQESKIKKISKRDILEGIISSYMQSLKVKKKKDDLSKSFQRANQDEDIINMAEDGIRDYYELVKTY